MRDLGSFLKPFRTGRGAVFRVIFVNVPNLIPGQFGPSFLRERESHKKVKESKAFPLEATTLKGCKFFANRSPNILSVVPKMGSPNPVTEICTHINYRKALLVSTNSAGALETKGLGVPVINTWEGLKGKGHCC